MRLFTQLKKPIRCLAFSPDGRTLTAAPDRSMALGFWDLLDGTFHRWQAHADGPVTCQAFSPDGRYLAVGSRSGLALPYEYPELEYDTECDAGETFGIPRPVYAVAWAPNRGKRAVLATASLGVTLWHLTGTSWDVHLADGMDFIALAWAPDGSMLAATNPEDGCVSIWDLDRRLKPKPVFKEVDLPGPSGSIAFSSDSHTLAIAEADTVTLYDVRRSVQRGRALRGHEGEIVQVAFHPSGQLLATASDDGTVRTWDPRSGRQRECFNWEIGAVRSLAFAPDGMTCAAGGATGRVVVWDVEA